MRAVTLLGIVLVLAGCAREPRAQTRTPIEELRHQAAAYCETTADPSACDEQAWQDAHAFLLHRMWVEGHPNGKPGWRYFDADAAGRIFEDCTAAARSSETGGLDLSGAWACIGEQHAIATREERRRDAERAREREREEEERRARSNRITHYMRQALATCERQFRATIGRVNPYLDNEVDAAKYCWDDYYATRFANAEKLVRYEDQDLGPEDEAIIEACKARWTEENVLDVISAVLCIEDTRAARSRERSP